VRRFIECINLTTKWTNDVIPDLIPIFIGAFAGMTIWRYLIAIGITQDYGGA